MAAPQKMPAIDYQQAYMALEAQICDLRHASSICAKFAVDLDEAALRAAKDVPALSIEAWVNAEQQAIDHMVFVAHLTSRLAGDVFDKYFDAIDPDGRQVQS